MYPLCISIIAGALAFVPATSLAAETRPLSAITVDGKQFSLAAARGRVVIVNFWATWCAPCRTEMPVLDTYFRSHQNEGLTMVAVSVDTGASKKKLAAATGRFAFEVARLDDTLISRSEIPLAIPATRIYGRDGKLRFDSSRSKAALLDEAALQRVVTPLLAEATPTTR